MIGYRWIASYPKSGNTWLRALITAALRPDEPLDLDDLVGLPAPDEMTAWTDEIGIDPALLTLDELVQFRAEIFRLAAPASTNDTFAKTHLQNLELKDGSRLFDATTGRAVYLVRDPLDVALSYAHYMDRSIAATVSVMTRHTAVLDRPGAARPQTFGQQMSSWSAHVRSWIDSPPLPVHLMRYEDLHADAAGALAAVLDFFEISVPRQDIEAAVEATRMHRLQRQEDLNGFAEKSPFAERFFRSGTIGEGHDELSAQEGRKLRESAGDLMERLGYGATNSSVQQTRR